MSNQMTPARTAFSRVFLVPRGHRADRPPEFKACLRAGPLERDLGEITSIKCPDPDNYGEFIDIGEIQGEAGRPTLSLIGRYAANLRSELLAYANNRVPVDVQVHFGETTNPKDFLKFTKAVVLRNAAPVTYSTEDLGALTDEDSEKVDETLDLSGREVFEIVNLGASERASGMAQRGVVAVDMIDETKANPSIQMAVEITGDGATAEADFLWSTDGGATWVKTGVTTLADGTSTVEDMAITDLFIVLVSQTDNSMHVLPRPDQLEGGVALAWVEVATGFVASQEPISISTFNEIAYIGGKGGYIYRTDDVLTGVSVLDAGGVVTDDIDAVHALTGTFALFGTSGGEVLYTADGIGLTKAAALPAADAVSAVYALSSTNWLVGTGAGNLYGTVDQGQTWFQIGFPGMGVGHIAAIDFSNAVVGYMVHNNLSTGRVFRTYDAGRSWRILPEGSGMLPDNETLQDVVAPSNEQNYVLFGGTTSGATGVVGAAIYS